MRCPDVKYFIPLYLSGELDSAAMARFERHTAQCLSCRSSVAEQQELDNRLRAAFLSDAVDATRLRGRVLAEITKQEKAPFRWLNLSRVRMAFATAAALFVAITLAAGHQDNARYEEASIDHVNEVVMATPKEWQSEGNGIQRFVAERLNASGNLQQLSIPGYRLIHAKECELAKKHYVHLVYGKDGQQVSMYVLAGNQHSLLRRITTSLLPPLRSRTESGYNVTEGDSKKHRILLVSTLPQSEEQVIVKNVLRAMG
jgi:anti-sigma factor RsiW